MDANKLKELCDFVLADPSFAPKDGVTHCNSAVQKICLSFGYDFTKPDKSDIMLANDIIAKIKLTWCKIDGGAASNLANQGKIVLAALKDKPHGHIVVVYPGEMVYSSKWKKKCPVLANVGARNGVLGANWCFGTEPEYYTDPKGI